MNNFEYLNRIVIGQYLPGNSWLYRRDPRARILAFSTWILALALASNLIAISTAFVVILIVVALTGIRVGYFLNSLKTPLPFLVILAVFQIFITPAGDSQVFFEWRFLHASIAGVLAAVRLLLRFGALILTINLASFTLSTSELIFGLRRLLQPLAALKIPVRDVVLMIQVTLRFIPLLAISAERIAKAQAARGAEWGTRQGNILQRVRNIAPLIVPLFLTSLRRAENLAMAMDARAYHSTQQPTTLIEHHFSAKDGIFTAVAMLTAAAILLA